MSLVQDRGRRGHCPDAPGPGGLSRHGGTVFRPYGLALLAEASCERRGRSRQGLPSWPKPWRGHRHGERRWEAELYRLQGELLLRHAGRSSTQEAEACFHQALDVARRQGAKSLELRAAMSLSRLWQRRASTSRPVRCWRRSTAGSPRGLIPPTCRTPRRCLQRSHELGKLRNGSTRLTGG